MISAVHLYTDLTAVCQTAALVVRPSPARPPVLELRQCAHRIRNTHPIASLGGALAGRAAAAGAPARAPAQHTHMHAAPHVSAPSPPRVPPGTESLAIQSPHPRTTRRGHRGGPRPTERAPGTDRETVRWSWCPARDRESTCSRSKLCPPRRVRTSASAATVWWWWWWSGARAARCTYGWARGRGHGGGAGDTRRGGTTRAVAVAGWACQCCSAPAAATRGRARQRGYRKEMGCAVLQKGTESVESFMAGR